jgi:uncharacterized protein YbcI
MKKLDPTMAQQVAHAVSAFQQQRTGYAPKAVTLVLSEDTLVVTLHEALSPAEKALARTPEGAAQVPSLLVVDDDSAGVHAFRRARHRPKRCKC